MTERKIERVFRTRKLTSGEVARDREIRRKVEEEFPPAGPARQAGPGALSEALRKAIRESDKSVYQIAKEADVSQIVVSRFLSGERDIRMGTADKLAQALGLTLASR